MYGRFRYSDLKEATLRGSLWVLYKVEQVLKLGKYLRFRWSTVREWLENLKQ
jgi:hypothetical protein